MPETPGTDPLSATCPACLADPGNPCYATSTDEPRRHPHRLRGLAAAKHLTQCAACSGIGWRPDGETATRVYVAGPYTSDPEANTRRAIEAGNQLLDLGYAPFVPHLSHYWHTLHSERPYEDWMRLDLAWVAVADAVLRLPGESSGADREVEFAGLFGIPVFGSIECFAAIARGDRP